MGFILNKASYDFMSQYLKGRINSLNDITCSLLSGHETDLFRFIDTIDSWDWEIENIIFSIANLEERNESVFSLFGKTIDVKYIKTEKIADILKVLLENWNKLIFLCESALKKFDGTSKFQEYEIPESLDLKHYCKGKVTLDQKNAKIMRGN